MRPIGPRTGDKTEKYFIPFHGVASRFNDVCWIRPRLESPMLIRVTTHDQSAELL